MAWLRAFQPLFVEEMGMTEQNYVDPAQHQPVLAEQMASLLARIGQLELEVRELRDRLALAQGGQAITTFPS